MRFSNERKCDITQLRETKKHPYPSDFTQKPEKAKARPLQNHSGDVNPHLESQIQSLKGVGWPLSANEGSFFEPRFGHDFSQVIVHTGTQAAESAWAVNAKAYTLGQDVVFGTAQYAQGTSDGRRLMAHELTHVVQQSRKK